MTRRLSTFVLLAATLPWTSSCGATGTHAVFVAANGDHIELNTSAGTFHESGSKKTALINCSNKYQTCLINSNGFAFSYFRNCNDVDYKRLTFHPKIVSALHGNIWMVFDESPNYMFHYLIPKGIVAIYVGKTSSFDFRSLIHNQNVSIDQVDAVIYHLTRNSGAVAACIAK